MRKAFLHKKRNTISPSSKANNDHDNHIDDVNRFHNFSIDTFRIKF
jgi:hypothetical protein